jgi:pyridoxine kinase
VREDVAAALQHELLPRANLLTPNLWELRRLSGAEAGSTPAIVEASRGLGRPVLTTSVPMGQGRIGAVYADEIRAVAFGHARLPDPPNGTGDVVAAVLAAGMVEGEPAWLAAEAAIRAAAETVFAAAEWRAPELPIVALGPRLRHPTAQLAIEPLDGPAAGGA